MAANIKFIPSLMDSLAGTSTEAEREDPIRLVLRDAGILIKMLKYLPWTIKPFRTNDKQAEFYISPRGLRDMFFTGLLTLMGAVGLLLAPVAILALPGFIVVAAAAVFGLVMWLLAWPLQGTEVVYSSMDDATMAAAKGHSDERWLFINGCITTYCLLSVEWVNDSANFVSIATWVSKTTSTGLPKPLAVLSSAYTTKR